MALAAAGTGKIVAMTGSVSSPNADGTSTELNNGSDIREGQTIVTGDRSSAEVEFADGTKLLFGPGTRARVLTYQIGASGINAVDLALIRGMVSGDATSSTAGSSFNIRSTGGVANVAGSRFAVRFTPSAVTSGQLFIVSASGTISVLPVNGLSPIPVPAGSQIVVGLRTPNPQPTLATDTMLATANGQLQNPSPAATQQAPTNVPTSDTSGSGSGSTSQIPNVTVTSPVVMSQDGSGSLN